jgi:hypothetical protein
MNLYLTATVACDEHDYGRACTEVHSYREPMTDDTSGFADRARRRFESHGWRFSNVLRGFCFCPTHSAGATSLTCQAARAEE